MVAFFRGQQGHFFLQHVANLKLYEISKCFYAVTSSTSLGHIQIEIRLLKACVAGRKQPDEILETIESMHSMGTNGHQEIQW